MSLLNPAPLQPIPDDEVDVPYIYWGEEEYQSMIGHFRLQLNGVMLPLRTYGLGPYVDGAINAVMDLVDQFGQKVRGKEKPILANPA